MKALLFGVFRGALPRRLDRVDRDNALILEGQTVQRRMMRQIMTQTAGLKESVEKVIGLVHSLKRGQDERDAKIKELIDKAAQTDPNDQKAIDDIKAEVDGVLAEFASKTDEAAQAATDAGSAAA